LFWQSLACDVVFCRNVLMYFTPDVMRDVVSRVARALLPNGFFFLGHAETLRGLSQEFRLCHTHDTFYYRRNDAVTAQQPASSLPPAADPPAPRAEVIERAPEKIAALPCRAFPSQAVTARAWDLGPVLEAMRLERFSAALQLIRALPADSEADPDTLLLQAVLLTNNGRHDESEQVCRRLLTLDEFNAGAHYLMALSREHAGDLTGAVHQGQTAIYLDAGFAMPHFHLGIMAKRSGDSATAQREFNLALSLFAREDAARLLLFGGGFSREMLLQLSRTELRAAGGEK
jgi:chemotaxis protein methyltransferase CheR